MVVKNVDLFQNAVLTEYLQENHKDFGPGTPRPAMIICPGGGFVELSEREAEPFAVTFLAFGCQAFVLRYSVLPASYPVPYIQLAEAVSYVREHHEELGVNENAIWVLGASAGGYLAAALGVDHQTAESALHLSENQCRANGMILCYPVIHSIREPFHSAFADFFQKDTYTQAEKSMNLIPKVSKDTCPAYIWATVEDQLVPVQNSLDFAEALVENGVSCELHLFPHGVHGQALGTEETACADIPPNTDISVWTSEAYHFMKKI